jgi:hypothetical protein
MELDAYTAGHLMVLVDRTARPPRPSNSQRASARCTLHRPCGPAHDAGDRFDFPACGSV